MKVGSNFKIQAYALILLRIQGHPCVASLSCLLYYLTDEHSSCVFYGDLFPNPECYDENVARNLMLLIEARKKFAYGPTVDYFLYRNCIGFVRLGDDAHPGCAVILSNKEECVAIITYFNRLTNGQWIWYLYPHTAYECRKGAFLMPYFLSQSLTLLKGHAGATFHSFLQSDGKVNIDSGGWGEFTCFANHLQVWVRSG